jgi:hypothetical protein
MGSTDKHIGKIYVDTYVSYVSMWFNFCPQHLAIESAQSGPRDANCETGCERKVSAL